jgi:hypothetical protein
LDQDQVRVLTPHLVDLRLHCLASHLQPPYISSRPKRRLLATSSNGRDRLHRVRHTIHVGDTTEMVLTSTKGIGVAHWGLELDRGKSNILGSLSLC